MLVQAGCKADIYGVGSRPLSFYDAVMHFSVEPDGASVLRIARIQHKTIFLWPNVWWVVPPSISEISRVLELANLATCLLFKSDTEKSHFLEYVDLPDDRCRVVPTGVSDRFLKFPDPALVRTVCDLEDYVLCVGLIEPTKNQLELVRATGALAVDLLFVGGCRDHDYFEQCVKEANGRTRFLPFLQPCGELLRSVIGNAALLAEPSFDPPGRSCLEGALMRKPLVMLETNWAREHFIDGPYYAGKAVAGELKLTIQSALSATDKAARVQSTFEHVKSRHSASASTEVLIKVLAKELV
jgi:glycosyltransferase involved in cell wall biosynthesis